MDRTEILQIKLPRAMDLGNTQVAAREFPLTLYARRDNYYTNLTINGIRIIPHFAPVQVFLYKNDVERGRYSSANGRLDFQMDINGEEPGTLVLYNLSVDTEVMLSIEIVGGLYHAI